MNRFTFPFLALGLTALAITSSYASDAPNPEAPPPPAAFTAIVPYDSDQPISGQHPDRLYVPYHEFEQLWEAAKAHRRSPAPHPSPVASAISSAQYEAKLSETALSVTGVLDLFAGRAWSKIPLSFGEARLLEARLDGAPAILHEGELLVEKPGRHSLTVTLEVDRSKSSNHLAWNIPASAATGLVIKVPEREKRVSFSDPCAVTESVTDGLRTVTVAFPSVDHIAFDLTEALPPLVSDGAVASAALRESVYVSANAEESAVEIAFAFTGVRRDRFAVRLPSDLTLIGLETQKLHAWKLTAGEHEQTLELVAKEPVQDQFVFNLQLRRPLPALNAEYQTPQIAPLAQHTEISSLSLIKSPDIELTPHPSSGLLRIESRLEPPADWRAVTRYSGAGWQAAAAYAGHGPLAYRLEPVAQHLKAEVSYLYQLNRRQVELFAALQLKSTGAPLDSVTLTIPAGYEVETVQSVRLQDWWRDGNRLLIRFQGPAPQKTPLVVYLVRREAAEPKALALDSIKVEGAETVTGDAIVAAHRSLDASLELQGDAREVSPNVVKSDYEVLLPLERKRAFTFTTPNFSGRAALSPVSPKYLATCITYAAVHEGWIGFSAKADLTVRQGSLNHLRFTLPSSLPEARVTGAALRELRTQVQGAARVYELDLQNDVTDQTDFTVELEIPLSGETRLPMPDFPDALRSDRFVVVDNASDGEMKVNSAGVDQTRDAELPWIPAHSQQASLFHVITGPWSISIALEHLEKTAGRRAFCAWAEMTTALRADGTEWHRAVWRLQNRSLQFLPIRLPGGAELISVRVAGESVRVDSDTVDGKPAVLIPLIKTKPGELSYDVEAVYRLAGPPIRDRRHTELYDPELIGITVERTFWNVFAPHDYSLRKFDGNMEPIISEVAATEKLDTELDELKQLSAIARTDRSQTSRALAADNLQKLGKKIRQEAGPQIQGFGGAEPEPLPQPTPALDLKKTASQNDWAQHRKSEVARLANEELLNSSTTPAASKSLISKDSEQAAMPNQQSANTVWSQNNRPVQAPTSGSTSSQAGSLYLNDNVVFHQAQKAPFSGEMTLSKSGAGSITLNPAPQSVPGLEVQPPAIPGLELPPPTQVLRSARGNFVAQNAAPQAQAGRDDAALSRTTVIGGAVTADKPDNQRRILEDRAKEAPMPAAPPAESPAAAPQALASGGGGATAAEAGMKVPPPPPPKPSFSEGRTTLTVDFPTEGAPLHFKKLKGAARLSLDFESPHRPFPWSDALTVGAFTAFGAACSFIRPFKRKRKPQPATA